MEIKLQESLQHHLHEACILAFEELNRNMSTLPAGDRNYATEVIQQMMVMYSKRVVEIMRIHFEDKIREAVKENTRRIVLEVFDKFIEGESL